MRLGLSRAEAEAKARVQLPFEHQGQVRSGLPGCRIAEVLQGFFMPVAGSKLHLV